MSKERPSKSQTCGTSHHIASALGSKRSWAKSPQSVLVTPNALLLVTCSPTPKPTAPPVSKAHSLAMRSTCAWNVIEYGWIGRIGEHVRPLRPTSSPSSLLFKVDPHGFPQNASWPNLLWMLLAACSKAWPSPSWSMVHPVHLQRISLACYCSCLHPFSDGNKKHPPKAPKGDVLLIRSWWTVWVWTIPLTNQKHLIQLDGFLALAELCFSFLLHFSRVVLQSARPLWVASVHLPQDFDELIQTGYVVNRVKHSKANKSLISNTWQSNATSFLIQATVEELSNHSITI